MTKCSNVCIFGIAFGVMWGIVILLIIAGFIAFQIFGNPFTRQRGDEAKQKRLKIRAEAEGAEMVEQIETVETLDGTNNRQKGTNGEQNSAIAAHNEPTS